MNENPYASPDHKAVFVPPHDGTPFVRYDNNVDDVVALSLHHQRSSPTLRRNRWIAIGIIGTAIFLVMLQITTSPSTLAKVAVAAAIVALYGIFFGYLHRKAVRRQIRALNREGKNLAIFGTHELEATPEGLLHRSQVVDSRIKWIGIERMVETSDYLFVYIAAYQAFIVPKQKVELGDVDTFAAAVRQHTEQPAS